MEGGLHLRIKDTGIRLHHADSLVERLKRVRRALAVRHHSGQIQLQVLGLQDGGEAVADALACAGRDLDVVAGCRQVAEDLGTFGVAVAPEAAADEDDVNGLGLFVLEGEEGLGGGAIYELDAEDLGGGEGGVDFDVEGWGLGGGSDLCVRL